MGSKCGSFADALEILEQDGRLIGFAAAKEFT